MAKGSRDRRQAGASTQSVSTRMPSRQRFGLLLRMASVLAIFSMLYLLLLQGLIVSIAWFLGVILPNHSVTTLPWVPPVLGVVLSILAVGVQYWAGMRAVVSSFDAVELGRTEAAHTHQMTEALCAELDIEPPTLMIAPMGDPNAIAIGRRSNGTVILSQELFEVLTDQEIKAILAHELAHLKHRDSIVMTFAETVRFGVVFVVGTLVILLLMGIIIVIEFILSIITRDGVDIPWDRIAERVGAGIATIVMTILAVFVLALSRYREFVADATAVEAIGEHRSLVRALRKMEHYGGATDQSAIPLSLDTTGEGRLGNLFTTHPPTDKRVTTLKQNSSR